MNNFIQRVNYNLLAYVYFFQLTIVDFVLYEILDVHKMMAEKSLDKFPNLKKLLETFENLENIKTYMTSSKFLKYPCCGRRANFGSIDKPLKI